MQALDYVIEQNFISSEEQQELCNIAESYLADGILQANPRGPGRFRAKIWDTPYCTPFIRQMGNRVIRRFQLMGYPVDPQLGWIISLIKPGASIHQHIDKYPYHEQLKAKHLRCNIMVSRDHPSGNPVIGGQEIDVPERSLWAFFPSEVAHGTQPIMTAAPRIAFQFGFVVPDGYGFPSEKKAP